MSLATQSGLMIREQQRLKTEEQPKKGDLGAKSVKEAR